jgi:hypothetical protein
MRHIIAAYSAKNSRFLQSVLKADQEDKGAVMRFFRRMLIISYIQHVTNKEVLCRAGVKRELLKMINKKII